MKKTARKSPRNNKLGLAAKKQFGQNFLMNKGVIKRMGEAAHLIAGEIVLEIGPGKGILTEHLLEKGVKVIAIEKDRDLLPLLKEKFAEPIKSSQLTLIQADVRDINLKTYKLKPTSYKLIANIPYYITGEIFRTFLENPIPPSTMVLMVQKEVGQRIAARDGKESILSISIKAYGKPTLVGYVARGNFFPAPNVDSAIISIEAINKSFFKGFNEEKFFEILKTGFAHKRKFLFSNLTALFSAGKLKKSFQKAEISLTARSEDLSPSDWKNLASSLT